jgi:hypothetical protein
VIDEVAVLVTLDGLGRAGIVRRKDGLFEIYEHWIWNEETRKAFNVASNGRTNWFNDSTTADQLYDDVEPQASLFGSLEDAINSVMNQRAFLNATRVK